MNQIPIAHIVVEMVRLCILFLYCTVSGVTKAQIFVQLNAISYPYVIPAQTIKYTAFSFCHFIYKLPDASTLLDYLKYLLAEGT